MEYLLLKYVHIISATLLFGTGLGSAFYKWRADKSGDIGAIRFASHNVVLADWLFTTPTVILQPVTGLSMAYLAGFSFTEGWLIASILLYVIAGLCWLPVVWLQMRMRDLAKEASVSESRLTDEYHRYARTWFRLGIPAFTAMIAVFFLMVFKPSIG